MINRHSSQHICHMTAINETVESLLSTQLLLPHRRGTQTNIIWCDNILEAHQKFNPLIFVSIKLKCDFLCHCEYEILGLLY